MTAPARPQHPVELILARQLASYLAMPILMVDVDGHLLFYNEPAEALLGRRYDTLDHAVRFATLAGIHTLVTFHHDPGHSDDLLDRLLEGAVGDGRPFAIKPGREGVTFDV